MEEALGPRTEVLAQSGLTDSEASFYLRLIQRGWCSLWGDNTGKQENQMAIHSKRLE